MVHFAYPSPVLFCAPLFLPFVKRFKCLIFLNLRMPYHIRKKKRTFPVLKKFCFRVCMLSDLLFKFLMHGSSQCYIFICVLRLILSIPLSLVRRSYFFPIVYFPPPTQGFSWWCTYRLGYLWSLYSVPPITGTTFCQCWLIWLLRHPDATISHVTLIVWSLSWFHMGFRIAPIVKKMSQFW